MWAYGEYSVVLKRRRCRTCFLLSQKVAGGAVQNDSVYSAAARGLWGL